MTIVIIEDSRTQRMKLEADLCNEGFSVVSAPDGESGLEACVALDAPPDAVITDVLMPGIDGYEVCRRLKEDPRLARVPVVVLTELSHPDDVLRAVDAGADNYCTKPYRLEQLLERVSRARDVTRADEEGHDGDDVDASHDDNSASRSQAAPGSRLGEILRSSLSDAAARYHQLELSRAELERVNDQREEMMRVVAHEVRSPLTALLVDVALAERAPQRVPELPRRVRRSVERLVRVIGDLEDLSAIDLGRLSVVPVEVELSSLVRSTLERVQSSLPTHRIVLVRDDDVRVLADTDRVEQVLSNLLTNAAKYSPSAERVEVEIERLGDVACVRVRDFGIGMSEREQQRVFERYFRAEGAKERAEGVGIGLYISARLVEAHGGALSVDSRPGAGSTFSFTLPLSAESPRV